MTKNLYELLSFLSQPIPAPAASPAPRPGYGLQGATVLPQAKSPYERTLRPGETRNLAELQDMLGEVILAAGGGALPGVQGKAATRQTAARIRPGYEKQFGEWFKGSKVTDESGKPLTLYHGTNKEFSSFSAEAKSSKTGNPNAHLGFFFSSQPSEASRYAENWGKQGGNVKSVHVSIKKPYEMPYKEFDDLAMAEYRMTKDLPDNAYKLPGFKERRAEAAAFARNNALARREELISAGYDGIVVRNSKGEPLEWIAFHPEQIKSATGNRGTYDPKSPRIDE